MYVARKTELDSNFYCGYSCFMILKVLYFLSHDNTAISTTTVFKVLFQVQFATPTWLWFTCMCIVSVTFSSTTTYVRNQMGLFYMNFCISLSSFTPTMALGYHISLVVFVILSSLPSQTRPWILMHVYVNQFSLIHNYAKIQHGLYSHLCVWS